MQCLRCKQDDVKIYKDTAWVVNFTNSLDLCGECCVELNHLIYHFWKNNIQVVGIDQKIILNEELQAVEICGD